MSHSLTFTPGTVIKHFDSFDSFQRELLVYSRELPFTPKLIRHNSSSELVLERINGIPYLDDLTSFDPLLLGKTIAAFHSSSLEKGICLCHIDNNPKNILRTDSGYFLIDFSESEQACPELDLIHLMMFWLDSMIEEEFLQAKTLFLDGYNSVLRVDPGRWNASFGQSYTRFVIRRARYGKALSPLLSDRNECFRLQSLPVTVSALP